jgi:AcrR family transcriptional regulator
VNVVHTTRPYGTLGLAMSPPTRRYHHGDLARALVNAAGSVLETRGMGAVTLRGAARAAGVSVGAPYRHFADKQALLAAVSARGFEALAAAMRARAHSARAPEAALERGALAWVRFASEHPAVYQLMFSAPRDGPADEGLADAAQAAVGVLAEAAASRDQGEVGAAPEAAAIARAVAALVHGFASLRARGLLPEASVEREAGRALRVLLDGRGPPARDAKRAGHRTAF